MDIPTHPAGSDEPVPPSRRSRRTVIAVALVAIVLASLLLLHTTLS